jgi:predicted nucleic acid-binding protein
LRLTFDSEPLIAYFLGDETAKQIVPLLQGILNGETVAYINIVNLSEIYYILHRINPSIVDSKIEILQNYGINLVTVTENGLWKNAAKIKSSHSMSLADAYAVATAIETGSTLVIGRDKEFNTVDIEKIALL